MKNRLSIVVLATLVVLAGLVWMVARSQRSAIQNAASLVVPVSKEQTPKPRTLVDARPQPAPVEFPVVQPAPAPAPVVDHIDADGVQKHVAQSGETVSSLASNLLGKDSKVNREAIINSNASLQADPDKLVAGKSYKIPSADEVVPAAATPAEPAPKPAQTTAELKYTARPGDTLAHMAGAFLGSADAAHQDAIVDANKSLQGDPDHVVAGKSYRIPAPDGLSVATDAPVEKAAATTAQPDADQVVVAGSPRTLRYTAKSGDTVTTLAIKLLGSDTQEARDAIIKNNPALKKNPDRVIAGQSYWIPAPTASIVEP